MRWIMVVSCALAIGASSAVASVPPDNEADGSNDPDKSHVHRHKPWKPRFAYRIKNDARAYTELNSRSDVAAEVRKDQARPAQDAPLKSSTVEAAKQALSPARR
jgi:hypothetical protein